MRSLVRAILVASLLLAPVVVQAFDSGQYENVDPNVRAWFKSVRSPHGVPCCDLADGHRLGSGEWDIDPKVESGYRVHVEGMWMDVPPEAVVNNSGNPVGEAVIWYVRQGPESVYIRCFVPGGGV